MSGYLRSTLFETDFDGDHVKVRLKPLNFADILQLQSAKDDVEAVMLFQKILPQYVEELTGLNDNAGSPIAIQEVCAAVYFAKLVKDIGVALVDASRVERPSTPAVPSAS